MLESLKNGHFWAPEAEPRIGDFLSDVDDLRGRDPFQFWFEEIDHVGDLLLLDDDQVSEGPVQEHYDESFDLVVPFVDG